MNREVGDHARIVGSPGGLDPETAQMFERCVGRIFQIAGFDRGLVELEVGDAFGEARYMRSIWIEPRFLAKRDDQG